MYFIIALELIISLLILPQTSDAVMAPDFVFNIGGQVVQIFSIVSLIFSSSFSILYQFIQSHLLTKKSRILFLITGLVIITLLSLGIAYGYAHYQQTIAYQNWLKHTHSKQLATSLISSSKIKKNTMAILQPNNFYLQNKNTSLITSNQTFQNITAASNHNYFILDAREDVEYDNGHFPDSIHIRFADLQAGDWDKLLKNKFIYVICWSGIRGKEVAEFLRTNYLIASYLETGASGWVKFGGKWIGNIEFSQQYSANRYHLVFTTNEIKSQLQAGTILVDSRDPNKYQQWHIPNSFNIAMLYTPTNQLTAAFMQIPPHSKVITVCDDYVNCFDAKVTGVELEKRGYEFLGRYATPWEYRAHE